MQTKASLAIAIQALTEISRAPDLAGDFALSRASCQKLAMDVLAQLGSPARNIADRSPLANEGAGVFTVYTDGACKGNPGPAGWGAVVLDAKGEHVLRELKGYLGVATNQIAELQAVVFGLEATPEGAKVELVSDSTYVLKGINEWRQGWEARGWVTSKGVAVANKAIWLRLFALVDARKITVRWVKGHSGVKYNERSDVLANEAVAAGTRGASILES